MEPLVNRMRRRVVCYRAAVGCDIGSMCISDWVTILQATMMGQGLVTLLTYGGE